MKYQLSSQKRVQNVDAFFPTIKMFISYIIVIFITIVLVW